MMSFFRKITTIGYHPSMTDDDERKMYITNLIIFIVIAFDLFFIPITIATGNVLQWTTQTLTFFLGFVGFALALRQKFDAALIYIGITTSLNIGIGAVINHDAQIEYFLIPTGMMALALIKKVRLGIILFSITLICFLVVEYLQERIPQGVDLNDHQKTMAYITSVVTVFIACFLLVYYNRKVTESYQDKVAMQKLEIEERNIEITDSIKYAKRIQSAILPPDGLVKRLLPNSFVWYRPKDIVAGDFYWLEENSGKVLIAAADCTGHGVPGALVSVVCHNCLTRSVHEFNLSLPGEVLDKTRELVVETFKKSEEEVKDGMDVALCTIDKEQNAVYYAGANNPLYHIKKIDDALPEKAIHDGEYYVHEIKATKQPIGQFDGPKAFHNHKVDVDAGDTIYLFSDGLADQFGGEKGKKFKYSQFKKLLLRNHNLPMSDQMDVLDKTFTQWKGGLEQVDDICVIGIRF